LKSYWDSSLIPVARVVRKFFRPLEQTQPRLRERRLGPIPVQLGDLLPPHLIDCDVHVPHNMEAVEHGDRGGNLFRDHGEEIPVSHSPQHCVFY